LGLSTRGREDARLVAAGAVPLHAAAFAWRGAGWAVTGDSGAGKTGVLLAFLARGAVYLAADRVVLGAGGEELVGRLEPIRVRAWHARALPGVRRALGLRTRFRFAALGVPGATFDALPAALRATPPFRHVDPWVRRFDRRIFIDLDPGALCNDVAGTPRAPFAGILLLERAPAGVSRVTRADPAASVPALVLGVQRDLSPTPACATVHAALERALRDRPVLRVEHAHGGALGSLVEGIADAMAATGGSRCASST
jgi:hypothetical protein